MSSTFHGIETAKRSLFTQTAALNTTGHNISNANTAGYSRQVVNMTASKPMEYPGLNRSNMPGQLGTGVEFASITRIRETFLDDQYRNENKSLGSWEIQGNTLNKLQSIINEPSDSGLRTVLDNFWKSWSDLSKDPENVTGRKIVRENAIALTDALNQTSKQLSDLNSDLTNNIQVKVNVINSTTTTIANLNREIQRVEGLGDNANDLRDQRDLLTDNLSKIVNISVANTPQGYNISIGGLNLVTGGEATATSVDALTSAYGAGDGTGDLNNGEVFGLLVSREKYVTDYQNQLDVLANTIANGDITVTIPAGSVIPDGTTLNNITYTGANRTLTSDISVTVKGLNGLHKLGYTFDTPAKTGEDFFTAISGNITAGNIQLNPKIAADSSLIATSLRTTGTGVSEVAVKGNNTLAVLLANLKDTSFQFNATGNGVTNGSIDDYFRSVVGQLGVQGQEANRQVNNQQTLVDQVDSQRQSVSGVSLDEEMSNLIKFQHAYGAASRFMTTYDQILDKLINGTGSVGR
ncbi:flagellar hook-associated protein 1 [Paenibacillus baekrokdamisoli]|uniref:Flagellar hook-associated protein 1 n=1 Tax=Paenibacillus baekrokdamisoli TaxID=1712516 RepID=A0A3G9JLX9_9BACL|nr:flagellar hook-associated protein FlgK [Paenibacillus baekrokdamisoli]MBB3069090.1 flagellar hook-associated protein 1 FlgK [Paenibacillus baekrokdamisoli]BBH23904.1 flagellar hook-associated protein 1 [Paenibacillus baekrokdamisoli]